MSKKDFRKNPSELFISSAEEETQPETQAEQTEEGLNIPKGYVLAPEPKSKRMQLLVQPTTLDAIKAEAAEQGLSMNELVNQILKEYLDRKEVE